MIETHEALILPETLELQQAGLAAALRAEGAPRPDLLADPALARLVVESPDNLTVYRGKTFMGRLGVAVQGSGARAKGKIGGTVASHDYDAVYQVYSLEHNVAAKYWFVNYSRNEKRDELKLVHENSVDQTFNWELEFELQGNDRGITSVWVYYETIRLKINGVSKDFTVTNGQSSGVTAPDGSPYPGEFTPVG